MGELIYMDKIVVTEDNLVNCACTALTGAIYDYTEIGQKCLDSEQFQELMLALEEAIESGANSYEELVEIFEKEVQEVLELDK